MAKTGFVHVIVNVLDDGIGVQQGRFALLNDDTALPQGQHGIAIEIQCEQTFSRTHRVGTVDNQHINAVRLDITHPLDAITEKEVGAGVAIRFAQLWKVLLRHAGYPLIDFYLPGLLHSRVFQHFFQGAAVATTDDDHFFRVLVGEQRRMGHHFVIQEIVPGGQHHTAVQYHQVAEGFGFIDFEFLKWRLLFMELALYLQGKSGALVLKYLGEPAFVQCGHVCLPLCAAAMCRGI